MGRPGSEGPRGNQGDLVAVVTLNNSERVTGDIPIFNAATREEMERMAQILSRTTRAMVHEIADDVFIVVRH